MYQDLQELAEDFWRWRAIYQPVKGDDIDRIERPSADWVPDWRRSTIDQMREQLKQFQSRHTSIDPSDWSPSEQVDYKLIGSAIARVHWELDVVRNWRRNAVFYFDQAIGPLFDELVIPPASNGNFGQERSHTLLVRMSNIPEIVDAAMVNLDQAARPFADLAIEKLSNIADPLMTTARHITPLLDSISDQTFLESAQRAADALTRYRDFLEKNRESMLRETAVGQEAYDWFLKHVAMIPWTSSAILTMGKQSLQHCIAQEAIEAHYCSKKPEAPLAANIAEQIASNAHHDKDVREFIKLHDLVDIPSWLMEYQNSPIPPYLAPFASWGCLDDLTSSTRLSEHARRVSAARDPRPVLVHEGVPGHYCQLAMSWAHPNTIRRRFYDSASNEGLGFYAEELLLQRGYFDDNPHSRKTLFTFMRLRALRVEVDVKLATGEFTIEDAAAFLQKSVPMDYETALWEAIFFASVPGQAISYTVGKLQLFSFLSAAQVELGREFDLKHWHNFVWINGNVPIALLQEEYLALNKRNRN